MPVYVCVHTCVCVCVCRVVIPDVWLCAAVTCHLVLGEVCVVRGGDKIMCHRMGHILIDSGMVRVEHIIFLGQHIHGEAILSHQLVILGCLNEQDKFTIYSLSLYSPNLSVGADGNNYPAIICFEEKRRSR